MPVFGCIAIEYLMVVIHYNNIIITEMIRPMNLIIFHINECNFEFIKSGIHI